MGKDIRASFIFLVVGILIAGILGYFLLFSPSEEPQTLTTTTNTPKINPQSYVPPDEKTARLYSLWKEKLFEQSGITEEYFNEHFAINLVDISYSGFFDVNHNFSIGWFKTTRGGGAKFELIDEGKPMFVNNQLTTNRSVTTIDNEMIKSNIAIYLKRPINKIISMEELNKKLNSCNEKIIYMPYFNLSEYHPSNFSSSSDYFNDEGRLIIKVHTPLNWEENKCKVAEVDLETGNLLLCEDDICMSYER